MRRRPTPLAHHPCRKPPHQLGLLDHDFDHDERTANGHHVVECRGLCHRARKPVEDESLLRIVLGEPVTNDADHHVVLHQLAASDGVLRPESYLSPVVRGLP